MTQWQWIRIGSPFPSQDAAAGNLGRAVTERAPQSPSTSPWPAMFRLRAWQAMVALAVVSGPLGAAPDGEQLYGRHCAACHGNIGQGGIGLPLALSKLIRSLPDSYLETTIRRGRPGRVMPAFEDLSDAQVQAIVAHLRGWTGGPTPVLPDVAVVGVAARGEALYAEHCAACHGADLQGASAAALSRYLHNQIPTPTAQAGTPAHHR